LLIAKVQEERRGEARRGERGVIAKFEMVVEERQTDRQMFHHLPQQPFERLRVYMVKLPSLFSLCSFVYLTHPHF
jgi:hypothetical protein